MDEVPRSLASHVRSVLLRDANLSALPVGVNTSSALALVRYRKLFFQALHRVEPRVAGHLTSDHGCELMREFGMELENVEPDSMLLGQVLDRAVSRAEGYEAVKCHLDRVFRSPDHEEFRHAADAVIDYVQEWQQQYKLTDGWLAEAAYITLQTAVVEKSGGHTYSGPLILPLSNLLANPHHGIAPRQSLTSWELEDLQNHHLFGVPIYLNELYLLDILEGIDGFVGTFDPRTEKVAAAKKRLLAELKPRIHKLVDTIASLDRSQPGVERFIDKAVTSFERLARYQVLGESEPDIAYTDGVDVSTVSEQVNDAARVIGLTRRKGESGRPSDSGPRRTRLG